MTECNKGTCDIGTNQNRGKAYKLKCSDCGFKQPLYYNNKTHICPKCGNIMFWTPIKKEVKK